MQPQKPITKRPILIVLIVVSTMLLVYFAISFTETRKIDDCRAAGGVWNSNSQRCDCISREMKPPTNSTSYKEYRTKSGKIICITETHPIGENLSTVKISSECLHIETPIVLKDINPIEKVIVSDLNKDGYDEIYITTRSIDTNSISELFGFASDKDNGLTQINLQNNRKDSEKGGIFEGCLGHEIYKFEKEAIVLEFPIYKEKDGDSNPTGATRVITYALNSDKSGYNLEVTKASTKN
ncbi:MAG TPA: hypothetical protein VFC36_03750 [Paludibacter sp.]|nr:hypothetical protein [Paludibacter sp.]